MLTFFRLEQCPDCDAIEESLAETTMAHKVIRVPDDGPRPEQLPEDAEPPLLLDNGDRFSSPREIRTHIAELQQFKNQWDSVQSDACYCDDEGNPI